MSEEKKLRPVIQWGNKLICPDWDYFVSTMREFFDAEEVDTEIKVSFVRMTDAEVEALDEFTGF